MLLDVRDNVGEILNLYCLELLVILELFEKAAIIRKSVLFPLRGTDYFVALDKPQDFVLSDTTMFKLFPQLIVRVELGLNILHRLSTHYELY